MPCRMPSRKPPSYVVPSEYLHQALGFRASGTGFRMLGVGSGIWILGFIFYFLFFWELGFGIWDLGFGFWVGFRVQGSGHRL